MDASESFVGRSLGTRDEDAVCYAALPAAVLSAAFSDGSSSAMLEWEWMAHCVVLTSTVPHTCVNLVPTSDFRNEVFLWTYVPPLDA